MTFSGARRTGNFFNQAMWVPADRDGALRAPTARIDFNLCKRLGEREHALIFRLKMLRRVARAAIEMHLMEGGGALEGRPVIIEVKCFVPSPRLSCARAIDQVYDRSGSPRIIIRGT